MCKVEFEQAKKRAEELKPLLKYYTQKYFDDEQVVSDYEYDMLMRELKGIEKEYPELITKDRKRVSRANNKRLTNTKSRSKYKKRI